MEYFAGLDVSAKDTSVCIVDASGVKRGPRMRPQASEEEAETGKIVREVAAPQIFSYPQERRPIIPS
jgi:hypothetical protein